MKRLLRRQASHGRDIDADPVESEDEQQLPTEYARGTTNFNRDEEQAHQSVPETRGRGGDDHGFGGSGYLGTGADEEANAHEGEGQPLLREEVAGYINVDFRDGTGPSALPPNDVARAFREAEDFAPVGRGSKFWAGMTGVDGVHHPGRVGGVQGGGRAGSGRRGGSTVGRTRVVHVESATTGKFFKVYEGVGGAATTGAWFLPGSGNQTGDGLGVDGRDRGHGGGGGGSGGGGREGLAEDKAATAERLGISVREVSIMRLDKGLEAGVLLVQGILAGLTLASLYAVLLGDSLESFIAAYEAQAGEWRRAMFLLCTLALAGTEDQLIQAKGKREVWQTLTWSGRLELRACVFLYGGCLVSTLVCAVADTVIANANGSESDSWYTSALEEPSFQRKIHIWYGFNLARFLFAWAGWFLVCRRGWRASLLGDQSQMELKGQRDKLSAANEQISHLNGRSLDPLTTKELQELRGALKKALNNTERQIDLR